MLEIALEPAFDGFEIGDALFQFVGIQGWRYQAGQRHPGVAPKGFQEFHRIGRCRAHGQCSQVDALILQQSRQARQSLRHHGRT
jgi:hypothetical protein